MKANEKGTATHYMEVWRNKSGSIQVDTHSIFKLIDTPFISDSNPVSSFKTIAVWYITPKKQTNETNDTAYGGTFNADTLQGSI